MFSQFRCCLALVSCFYLASCNSADDGNPKPVTIKLGKDTSASVAVRYGAGDVLFDKTLAMLFDNNRATFWTSSQTGCDRVTFYVELNRPKYVKKITLIHHGDVLPSVGSLSLGYSAEIESFGISSMSKKLQQNKIQTIDVSNDYYFQILKGKSVTYSSEECPLKSGDIEIEEIQFEFSDDMPFRPTINATELYSAIESVALHNSAGWQFTDDYHEPNKEKYLSHLLYYGLNGDVEADKLIRNYAPPSAELSEEVSNLRSWYKELKKTKNEKGASQ